MVELLLDHDISAAAFVTALGAHGIIARTAFDLGLRDAYDHELLTHAAGARRVFVTRNASHFTLLHRAWLGWGTAWQVSPAPQHAGIIALTHQPHRRYADIATAIHRLLHPLPPAALANMLLVWNTRTGLWAHIAAG